MINASNNFIEAMTSPQKKLYIKIEIYDSKMNYIKEITKQVKNDLGVLKVSGDSAIRRSFKMSLDNSLGDFIFGEDNLIWIDKRIKLFIGLKTWDGEIEYVPMGIFILTEPEDSHTINGKTSTINAVDKGYLLTGNRGKFINEQIIETGTKITDAIRIIAQGAGETLFNFDTVLETDSNGEPILDGTGGTQPAKVPYELTYSGDDNRWDAIEELVTLAKCKIFYDVEGRLRLKNIDLNSFEKEPPVWEYVYGRPSEKLYAGNVRQFNDSNLSNHIRVLGGSSDTAEVIFDLTVDDNDTTYGDIWSNHPYSIQNIGKVSYFHNNNNPDPLITTQDEALWRAKFELMNRLGFTEDVSMTISPNYLHDADDVIWLEDKENGIMGSKYIIRSTSIPLSPSLMSVDLTRYEKVIDDWDFIN